MNNTENATKLNWLLERRKALECHIQQLTQVAEVGIESSHDTKAERARIGQVLNELSTDLQGLLTLKADGRFFEDIIDQAPRLQSAVEQLREDHLQLLTDLDAMCAEVEQAGHLRHIGRLLHGWLTRFQELDKREIDLVQNVWNVDIGTLD